MEKRRRLIILILGVISFLSVAIAATKTESFISNRYLDTSDLVWNIGRGELHPPLRVVGWDSGSGASITEFDVGDGSDGAFILANYSRFSQNGDLTGQIIRLDTDAMPEIQVTQFVLEAGWVLKPIGSKPLVIRSQTGMTIDGDIDCSGDAGSDANNNFSVSVLGGTGRCGGGRGGNSIEDGGVASALNDGVSGGTNTAGGEVGPTATLAGGQGGGGGGAYIKTNSGMADKPDPTSGQDPTTASAANVGTIYRDDQFSILDGAGSGGGGGSAYDGAVNADDSSGAGGGAGGGNVRFYVVEDITVNGNVLADGGNGGNDSRGGGAGGGGGGGSILMFAGGDILNNGTIRAQNGAGGSSSTGGSGGEGAWGRTWIVEKDGFASGNFEEPETQLNLPGAVMYKMGTFDVYSKVIDFQNTRPLLNSIAVNTTNGASGTITHELSFSAESSASSFPAFAAAATFDDQEVERYMKFHLQVTNTDISNPIRINDIVWDYTGAQTNNYEFTSGCGDKNTSAVIQISRAGAPYVPALFVFLVPVFYWLRRKNQI